MFEDRLAKIEDMATLTLEIPDELASQFECEEEMRRAVYSEVFTVDVLILYCANR